MKNLKIFDTPQDIKTYINKNKKLLIGYGSEGYAYLDKDNNVLKEIRDKHRLIYDYTIITSDDFNLESFIFPDELYIANNDIYGYKTRFFPNDVFCDIYRRDTVEIDLEKLLDARLKVIEDIRVLTKSRYGLDVRSDALFDGERLALIDTLCYVKDDSSLKRNIKILDNALSLNLYKLDPIIGKLDMPFENKVKLLIRKNRGTKILVPPVNE